LADRSGDRDARIRHQEAAQHRRAVRGFKDGMREGDKAGEATAPQVTGGKTVDGEVKSRTESKA